MRKELRLDMSFVELVTTMSEGNPGCVNALMSLIEADPKTGMLLFLHLDDMNIRGTQAWIGYKDYCGCDIQKFIEAIKSRDAGMVEKINQVGMLGNHEHKAVRHGAGGGKREMLPKKELHHESFSSQKNSQSTTRPSEEGA